MSRTVTGQVVGALAALLAATTVRAEDADLEREALARQYPQLVALYDSGMQQSRSHQPAEAARTFEALARKAPALPGALRWQCVALQNAGEKDAAIDACERAVRTDASVVNRLELAHALLLRGGAVDDPRADAYLSQVLTSTKVGSPAWIDAKATRCQMALEKESTSAIQCVDDLLAAAPTHPMALYYGSIRAAQAGDLPLALQRLEAARPGLQPAEYERLRHAYEESMPFYARWEKPLAWGLGLWLGSFLLLTLLGLVLSRIALSMARRLATAREMPHSGAAALLRAIYRAVLSLAAIFFYVSLPLVALTILGAGGGLIYACFALGRIPVKALIVVGTVTVYSLWAVIKSLFTRVEDRDPGTRLDWAQAPRLRALLDEVAKKLETRPVDSVYLTPSTEMAVLERGGLTRQLGGERERCLVMGVGLLDDFQVLPFKSVLAHEFGHFSHQDTAGGGLALRVRPSLYRLGMALAGSGAAAWYNPAWLFYRAFWAAFLRISQGASRLQEVLADRRAIWAYGSRAFEEGYLHVLRQGVRFEAHASATLNQVLEQHTGLGNLYRFVPDQKPTQEQLEEAINDQLNQPPSAYDSHPSSADRVAWAKALQRPHLIRDGDDGQVWSLFEDREGIERQMTEALRFRMAMEHEVIVPREKVEGEEGSR